MYIYIYICIYIYVCVYDMYVDSMLSSLPRASCGKSGGKSTSKLDSGTTRMVEALPGYSTKRAGSTLQNHRRETLGRRLLLYLTLPALAFLFASVILSESWQILFPSCGFPSFSCYATVTVFW